MLPWLLGTLIVSTAVSAAVASYTFGPPARLRDHKSPFAQNITATPHVLEPYSQCFPIDIPIWEQTLELAARGSYIAVGIPRKSTVVLFNLHANTLHEIQRFEKPALPGFGRVLAFTPDALVIGTGLDKHPAGGGSLYSVPLSAPDELHSLLSGGPGRFDAFSIASDDDRILLSTIHFAHDALRHATFSFFYEATLRPFNVPPRLHDILLTGDLDLHEDTVLIGAPKDRGAWLIDLSDNQSTRFILGQGVHESAEGPTKYGTAVALTSDFAALSAKEHVYAHRTVVVPFDGLQQVLPHGGPLTARGALLAINEPPGIFNENMPRIFVFRVAPDRITRVFSVPGLASRFTNAGLLTLGHDTDHRTFLLCSFLLDELQ